MNRTHGKDFFNIIMNKTKRKPIPHNSNRSSSMLSSSTQILPNKSKAVTIDIDSYHKALDHSVSIHKSILKQILHNQQLSYMKQHSKENTDDNKEDTVYKPIHLHQHQNENNRYQTLFLMDKSGNDVIKFVCSNPNNELNGSCSVHKIETQRACHCPRKVLKSHQRSKSYYTSSNATSINKNSHNKRNCNNTLKSSNGCSISGKTPNLTSFTNNALFNQDTPLEELQRMNEEISTLITEKVEKMKQLQQDNDLNNNNNNNGVNSSYNYNQHLLRSSKISSTLINNKKRYDIDNIEEEDSFIKELSSPNNKNNNNNSNSNTNSNDKLKQSQNQITPTNTMLIKSASSKAMFDENEVINRRLEKSGLTKEYLLNAIQRLRDLKEDGNSRNKSSFDVNELFNIHNFRKPKSNSVVKDKINYTKPLFEHSKFNPKPHNNINGSAPIVNAKYVTDRYLNKMKYSGTLSENAVNKIKNLKVSSNDDNYYKNVIDDI